MELAHKRSKLKPCGVEETYGPEDELRDAFIIFNFVQEHIFYTKIVINLSLLTTAGAV